MVCILEQTFMIMTLSSF